MPEALTVAVVGNAPTLCNVAEAVDACSKVVRVNKAFGFLNTTGARIDDLVLINCGGQMEEWLRLGEIERSPAFRAAPAITLPIHPGKADMIVPALSAEERESAAAQDFSTAASARYGALGKTVQRYSAQFFADSMADLGHAPLRRDGPAPSTGYLAARWWLTTQDCHVHAFGFGFDGWCGHDWVAERRWFERAAAEGRLTRHPVEPAQQRRAAA